MEKQGWEEVMRVSAKESAGAEPVGTQEHKIVVGLMSGTSADGIDAALVDITGAGLGTRASLIEFSTYPFPEGFREEIFLLSVPETCGLDRLVRMNVLVGELFAEATLAIIAQAGLAPTDVDLIGSHGQTVRHLPGPEPMWDREIRATLQIGEPAVIAERTGITTVADFRPRDLAAGGEGAPLVPFVDYLLFRSEIAGRALLNIGGIANVTLIPAAASAESVVAFDLGPGNMLLDSLAVRLSEGRLRCDEDGVLASKGSTDGRLVDSMLNHPFLKRRPPKSTGREEFGDEFCAMWLGEAGRRHLSPEDTLATATEFVAQVIARGVLDSWVWNTSCDEVIASGGGVHNPALMGRLRDRLDPGPRLLILEDVGLSSDAKEAVAFAVLANETICGHCNNLPGATGAREQTILGKIVPGRGDKWIFCN